MRPVALPGVYVPRGDSELLLQALALEVVAPDTRVLDICTGTGVLALAAARRGARVVAVDLSRRAVASARMNARLGRARIDVRRGSLFEAVAGERFDLVLCNPPFVPCEGTPKHLAWDAGADGRALLEPLCGRLHEHLRPGGRALLVHSSLAGEHETLARLRSAGLEAEVVLRRRGPLGPITAARVDFLERTGRLRAGGAREEDLLVVRAVAAAGSSTPEARSRLARRARAGARLA